MIKTNTAISNFPIGRLVNKTDGSEITTGTVTGTYIIDGSAGDLSGSISYNATAKCWVIDIITSGELNGSVGGYSFSHTDAVGGGVFIGIKTVQKLVSDLNDFDSAADTVTLSAATEAQIDAIEADTDELQSDDVPGLIAGLNDLSVADIIGITITADGADLATVLKQINAMAVGKIMKSGNTYTYYDDDGTTPLFTLTVTTSSRIVE